MLAPTCIREVDGPNRVRSRNKRRASDRSGLWALLRGVIPPDRQSTTQSRCSQVEGRNASLHSLRRMIEEVAHCIYSLMSFSTNLRFSGGSGSPIIRRRIREMLDRGFVHSGGASVLHAFEETLAFLPDLGLDVFFPAWRAELVGAPQLENVVFGGRVTAYHAHEVFRWSIQSCAL